MASQEEFSFTRYLAAKVSVDDRALNRNVWDALARDLPESTPEEPLRVLEIGTGIGTMVERMVDWGLLKYAYYTAIDSQPENINLAGKRLGEWEKRSAISDQQLANSDQQLANSDQRSANSDEIVLSTAGLRVALELEAVDLFDFVAREIGRRQWDLIVAHAFLDLADVPAALPSIFSLLRPGGLFYFTINFDGLTVLEPAIDPAFDERVIDLYHRTMDERVTAGRPSGDSHTGRHLFKHLKEAGGEIFAAGSSDWVVYPGVDGYPDDEAYFLHFIVHTFHQALLGNPELEGERFEAWIAERHAQIERGELVYLAHQIDFVGRRQ